MSANPTFNPFKSLYDSVLHKEKKQMKTSNSLSSLYKD